MTQYILIIALHFSSGAGVDHIVFNSEEDCQEAQQQVERMSVNQSWTLDPHSTIHSICIKREQS